MFGARQAMFILLTCLAIYGCAREQTSTQPPVERGKYLVTFGGCHDCHTPKIPRPDGPPVLDTAKLLSGHPENAPVPSWSVEQLQREGVMATTNPSLTAWAGPWGVSFATNLTPDKDTGIGE